jgi:hypothetical protein
MSSPFSSGGFVDQAQTAAAKGVQGFGEAAKKPLMQQIGTTLGGLNSIGSLRSGAVPTALEDVGTSYGNQVGAYSKMAAGESLGAGLAANEQNLMKQQLDQQRKSQLLSAIGGLVGTGIGFATGGPFGAKVGGGLGRSAGNQVSGGGGGGGSKYGY